MFVVEINNVYENVTDLLTNEVDKGYAVFLDNILLSVYDDGSNDQQKADYDRLREVLTIDLPFLRDLKSAPLTVLYVYLYKLIDIRDKVSSNTKDPERLKHMDMLRKKLLSVYKTLRDFVPRGLWREENYVRCRAMNLY